MSVRDQLADRFDVDTDELDPVRVALYATLVGLVLFYLSPLESGLMTALKTEAEFATSPPFVPPTADGFTLEPFGVALDTLSSAILNSIMLAVPATIISAFAGSLAAYGLTNFEWRGQLGVVGLFIAGIFIPYQAVLIPLSRLWAIVNTKELLAPVLDITVFSTQVPVLGTVELATHPHYASIINLIITHAAYGIPITTLLFRSYYKKLSSEMLEAARLDGASAFTVYRRIVLPLSVPMFAVTLIYQFTQIWNDLLFALIIIPSGSGPAAVATIALNELTGGIIQTFNTQMAGAFVAALPTLLVYVLFGDKFAEGVAGGT